VSEGSYNAVTWLLDRNVEEGRGNKLAFDDTVSRLTYGELQRETRRAANMLRRLGVRREERVAMIMLDTIDFPIVFLGAIFPILVNTITGVRTVNADFVKVARSFGSNDWQMFLTVVLPSSVPLLLTGLRLGLGHALVGIVVGEMYGATHGLGFLIATAGARFQTDKVMVGIIIIAAAGIVMTGLLRLIERRFERWRPSVGN
jgi:ABC-type spermidine/putrescine transport system permease subunit I